MVTITTVGYGDYYPVTTIGRIIAIFVMFSGIGIVVARFRCTFPEKIGSECNQGLSQSLKLNPGYKLMRQRQAIQNKIGEMEK